MARNVLKFGPPLRDVSGPSLEAYPDPAAHLYVNHPPLVYWCTAAMMKALGETELAVKTTAIVFAVGALGLFAGLAARLLGGAGALAATVLLAATPMFAYVSVASVHQVPTLFFILLVLVTYWRWCDTGRHRWLAAMAVAQLLGCWTDWPAYYAAPVVLLHDMIERRSWRSPMWVAVAVNVAAFAAYAAYVHRLDPANGVGRLLWAAGSRTGPPPLPEYAAREARDTVKYFTAALPLAALAGFIGIRRDERGWFILLLPLLSLDQIVFSKECWFHDYYGYYWGPALALGAAAFGRRLWERGLAARLLASLLLAAFAAQSGWQMFRLVTRVEKYEVYRAVGEVCRTLPREARILVAMETLGLYTPFYADRFFFQWNGGQIKLSDTTRPIFEGDEAALVKWLERNPMGVTHIVWARGEEIRKSVPFLQGADPREFRIDVPGPLRDYLARTGSFKRNGFRITVPATIPP